jgi:hypothetical protein
MNWSRTTLCVRQPALQSATDEVAPERVALGVTSFAQVSRLLRKTVCSAFQVIRPCKNGYHGRLPGECRRVTLAEERSAWSLLIGSNMVSPVDAAPAHAIRVRRGPARRDLSQAKAAPCGLSP